MFDKWFNQDIEKVLSKRNCVIVVDESAHLDLLQKVLPAEGLNVVDLLTNAL